MLVAIEIGGTKLQLGLHSGKASETGWAPWTDFQRRQVDVTQGAAGIRQQMEQVLSDWQSDPLMMGAATIEAVGIGFGGPVQNGRTIVSHQIEGWADFPLSRWITDTFGIDRVSIANDCDTAALAEASHGAGTDNGQSKTVFYVTVGTGVGGGLVIDQRLHGQGRPSAAEIGHLRPGLDAENARATVESIASGWGIANRARELLQGGGANSVDGRQIIDCAGSLEQLDVQLLSELAMKGNELAAAAIGRGVQTLGWAIAQVVTLVCPHVVVVGGGVSLMPEPLFMQPLRETVSKYVFPPMADSYRIEPAALGEEVVVQGALTLAAQA